MSEGLLRYQILQPLGSGGQGHTYRAVDTDRGNHPVAIKAVSLRAMTDWKSFELFERESAILRRLNHHGIPKYYDSFSVEKTGDYFLVMELIEGKTLHDQQSSSAPLPPEQLQSIMLQLLDVLEYLHSLAPPVIHRDIKPANVILRPDGRITLVDFGGVRLASSPDGGSSTMIGTLGYMAPEQLHGEVSPATDIYSLAATVVSMFAGRPADELEFEGLKMKTSGVVPPSRLRDVLDSMLEPNPKERLESTAKVREALGAAPPPRREYAQHAPAPAPATSASRADFQPSSEIQLAARVPAPFSIVVWLFSMVASVAFVIGEVAVIPLVGILMRSLWKDKGRAERELKELGQSTAHARRSMQYLAGATYPLGDETRALPPSKSKPKSKPGK